MPRQEVFTFKSEDAKEAFFLLLTNDRHCWEALDRFDFWDHASDYNCQTIRFSLSVSEEDSKSYAEAFGMMQMFDVLFEQGVLTSETFRDL